MFSIGQKLRRMMSLVREVDAPKPSKPSFDRQRTAAMPNRNKYADLTFAQQGEREKRRRRLRLERSNRQPDGGAS